MREPEMLNVREPAHRQPEFWHEEYPDLTTRVLAIGLTLEKSDCAIHVLSHTEIKRKDLGRLPWVPADVGVWRLENGNLWLVYVLGSCLPGRQKLVCELTVRNRYRDAASGNSASFSFS